MSPPGIQHELHAPATRKTSTHGQIHGRQRSYGVTHSASRAAGPASAELGSARLDIKGAGAGEPEEVLNREDECLQGVKLRLTWCVFDGVFELEEGHSGPARHRSDVSEVEVYCRDRCAGRGFEVRLEF